MSSSVHLPKAFRTDLKVISPGRVNLIGEHTDYNLGFVLPAAIDKNIYFYFQRNQSSSTCSITSMNFQETLEIDLTKPNVGGTGWSLYVIGVLEEIRKKTDKLSGFDCYIESQLPIGAGISSSAALECGLAIGLNRLYDLGLSELDIIYLAQQAEHNYVGTKCGIMDQFAVVKSQANHVILLDCKSLASQHLPFNIDPYQLLLLNTNVSHNLSTSEYNTRRQQCQEGVTLIQKGYPDAQSLRDVTLDQLLEFKDSMNPKIFQRCKYVIEENDRVLDACEALETDNLKDFGKLMYASHHGLKHQYEVSCEELDFLVDSSKEHKEILGSRMMGGGFGGCVINIIHKDFVQEYIQKTSKTYQSTFQKELTPILTTSSDGVRIES